MSEDSDSRHAALSLLSLAAAKPCTSTAMETPQFKTIPRLVSQQSELKNDGHHPVAPPSPLVFIGVTLERPPQGSWGMSLFRISNYLVVGCIQQEIMQCFTSWAWATVSPPRLTGDGLFRSKFNGPLYPTSLLQIVAGDVILFINGQTQCDDSIWNASRLDIIAVRFEPARLTAHQILNTTNFDLQQTRPYRAAYAAFQTLGPLLRLVVPRPCQRQLFPTPSQTHRIVSDESLNLESSSQAAAVHLPLHVPDEEVSETQVHEWLQVRKNQWRSDRAKRRRCENCITKLASSPVTPRMSAVVSLQEIPYEDPLVFLCFVLKRDSTNTPWGIHVSLNGRNFLGIGQVNDAISTKTIWARATCAPPPTSFLLSSTSERVIHSLFQHTPPDSGTPLCLQAGDFILSVSGHPVSIFDSLAAISSHMTRSTELTVVAVRHRVSSEVARLAVCEGRNGMEVTTKAFRQLLPILQRASNGVSCLVRKRGTPVQLQKPAPPTLLYRNPLFRDDQGVPILFEDQGSFDVGTTRLAEFLPPITSFPSWLKKRKATWRENWVIHPIDSDGEWWGEDESSTSSVANDFWTQNGYSSFEEWLAASTFKWKQSYSWNCKKREKLTKEFEEVVHFPSNGSERDGSALEQGRHWLRVRKQQWRFLRRKRQRRLQDQRKVSSSPNAKVDNDEGGVEDSNMNEPAAPIVDQSSSPSVTATVPPLPAVAPRPTSVEMSFIDALIEQESQQKALKERHSVDISFLFDARLGCPDDIVVHCLEYLPRSEHGRLLCVSTTTSTALKDRDEVWRQLCPGHWVLPRRPRKRWHEIYVTKIYEEERESRKWADDFLNKAAEILFKQDNLNQIEKLVKQGEKRVDFDINYISAVVCERNSLLNLAAIYSRIKVVRWLVEMKGADIETYDRGGFTPLLNAAWSGDRQLVRYLLSQGADRSKIGLFHFFKPLSSPDFKGLNAEGWARKKGHHKLADLIHIGL